MKIRKAVITAAGPQQRTLALQSLIDRDGEEKSVLRIILDEVRSAHVHEICIVVQPGDEEAYARAADDREIRFIVQPEPLGYANAIHCAQQFTGDDPFLHLVGDHLYVGHQSPTRKLIDVAQKYECSVSAVQATRESLLPLYGTVRGHRFSEHADVYRVDRVVEKPTPTEAEQQLTISGMRAGHYLCFFGMHVLTPTLMDVLRRKLHDTPMKRVTLSHALAQLASQEQYLAVEQTSRRYDVGVKYGLFRAQLALALEGVDHSLVLSQMLELVALRTAEAHEMGQGS